MTKKLSLQEKQNRKPASRACTFCHAKHLQCSDERPCTNCVKRNISDGCTDIVRKRVKYLMKSSGSRKKRKNTTSEVIKPEVTVSDTLPDILDPQIDLPTQPSELLHDVTNTIGVIEQPQQPPPPLAKTTSTNSMFDSNLMETMKYTNPMLDTTNDVLNKLLDSTSYYSESMSEASSILPVIQSQSLAPPATTHSQVSRQNSSTTSPRYGTKHDVFNSNFLNEEYLMLGDIITHSHPPSPSPSNTSTSEMTTASGISPSTHNYPAYIQGINLDAINQPRKKVVQKLKDSRPFIALGFSQDSSLQLNNLNNMAGQTDNLLDNNFDSRQQHQNFNSNNNQILKSQDELSTEYVSPLITHHIYQSVGDIYGNSVINFDYPQSYHSLTFFLKKRFSGTNLTSEEKQAKRKNLLIILKVIASYRPTFISAHKSLLKPQDLLFLEMSFQRCLMDYEKLTQLNSSPTIIWRRTGEIVSITDDLLSLLGYNLVDILSKRTFIIEMMYDDDSIVNYFQLYKSVAIGNLHSRIVTRCKLMKNPEKISNGGSSNHSENTSDRYIEFCSVWTVKRDLFDLPMLIVGQFLPVLYAGDGVRIVKVTPMKALAVGGLLYGLGAAYMFRNYFKNSSMRKIYTDADREYEKVHVMRYPQYDGNLSK
ncbi:Glucose starvation modulator protein 1 [Spathaspora sp. JA1]|nr:Glucose starvation modulator protein 1 [Spathaspora sp. JA1]